MRKPDWKIAVIGGSIAALGLGGFAMASQAPSDADTVPEGIRLQRDASVSIHSLSSVVDVTTTTAKDQASVASLQSAPSVASLDSVPQVAPAPQPAPAPAPTWGNSVSAASVASVSAPSVASVASADSVDNSN